MSSLAHTNELSLAAPKWALAAVESIADQRLQVIALAQRESFDVVEYFTHILHRRKQHGCLRWPKPQPADRSILVGKPLQVKH
jgi:hypothetical protein